MSNFNKEYFPDFHNQIIGGPEVVNGTGQVYLAFDNNDEVDPGHAVFLMDADEVLRLAEWLADQAWAAKREQWRERNTLCG